MDSFFYISTEAFDDHNPSTPIDSEHNGNGSASYCIIA
jgi:hypothetical protein